MATALEAIGSGDVVQLVDKEGPLGRMKAAADIQLGHKLAIRFIKNGENIIKYGASIGQAIQDINEGQHVHVHNVVSLRGRKRD